MEQNLLPIAIAIMFSLSAIVIGQGVSNGAVWLIEKLFSKKKIKTLKKQLTNKNQIYYNINTN